MKISLFFLKNPTKIFETKLRNISYRKLLLKYDTIKALFKLELLFFFFFYFSYISFLRWNGAKISLKKKKSSIRSNDTRKRNERKRCEKIADANRRGKTRVLEQPPSYTPSRRLVGDNGGLSEKCSDLCLDLHLAGLHSFVDGGVLPA